MLNVTYNKLKRTFDINKLAFEGTTALKSSNLIQQIIIPPDSLANPLNPHGTAQYNRYVQQAEYQNYPILALNNVLGFTSKGDPEIQLPDKMQSLIDYASPEGTDIKTIQDKCIESIFKYGLVGLKVEIKDGLPVTEMPKIKVIEGIKILDYKTFIDENGNEKFKFILIDESKQLFISETKSYKWVYEYRVLGLDADQNYYEALIPSTNWGSFNLDAPVEKDCIELVYPQIFSLLNEIPFVAINNYTCELKYCIPYLQNLIDLSLNIFRLSADLHMSLHMQSNPNFCIYGSNMKPSEVILGMYSVNVFKDSAAKAEYVSPSFGGIQLQKEKLEEMKKEAMSLVYSLSEVGNSSGTALDLKISSYTSSIVNLIKNIGNGITLILEKIGTIYGYDKDAIDYIPYTDFSKVSQETVENIEKETDEMNKNIEEIQNI